MNFLNAPNAGFSGMTGLSAPGNFNLGALGGGDALSRLGGGLAGCGCQMQGAQQVDPMLGMLLQQQGVNQMMMMMMMLLTQLMMNGGQGQQQPNGGSSAGGASPVDGAAGSSGGSSGGGAPDAGSSQSSSGASSASGGPPGQQPTGNVAQWIQEAKQVLAREGVDVSKISDADLNMIIQKESGGNPHAQNNWDSNAKAGHPSKGLMQTIDSTFNQYSVAGHKDIWNPVDNIVAGVRYAIARYGSIENVPGVKAVHKGGSYVGY